VRPRAVQQAGLDDTFIGQPPYSAAQPLDRPGGCLPTVEDPHDITPRLVGAHLPHGGQQVSSRARTPSRCAASRLARSLRMAFGSPCAGLDYRRHGRVRARRSAPAQAGRRPQDLQREHGLRGEGVDRVAQAAEMRPRCFQMSNDGQQVADRAGETIEPDHDQGFAGTDFAQQARQHGSAAIGAGGMRLEGCDASGRAEFVKLRIGAVETRA
jgi:hypothetical protein